MEPAHNPGVARAFRALLGDRHEDLLGPSMELSKAAGIYATDLETTMQWTVHAINESAGSRKRIPYGPNLITDKGAAVLDPGLFLPGARLRAKIADYVAAVDATFAVFSYGGFAGRKNEEPFVINGTDGATMHHVLLWVRYRLLGQLSIEVRKEEHRLPSDSDILANAARVLRQRQGLSRDAADERLTG
jgi:hypothetical protein